MARIVNMQHDGTTESIFEDLPNLTWTFKRSDISSASWTIPLSHINLVRAGGASGFGPKRTDFRIGVSSDNGFNWNTVHAGILGPVGLDTDKDAVECSGVGWLAWLEQPFRLSGYTMDFATDTIDKTDVIRTWVVPTPVEEIITELVDNLCSGTVLECVPITVQFIGTTWSPDPITDVTIGATGTVLSKIKELGELQEPKGYEFMMDWDKTLYMFLPRQFEATPEYMLPSISAASFAPSLDNIISMKWLNKGPKAITTIGMPITFPGQKGYSTYEPSKLTYRDWWQMVKVGSIKDVITGDSTYVDSYTDTYATRDRFPQRDLTITFDPTAVPVGYPEPDPKFWFSDRTGYIIHVDSEDWWVDYWRVNDYFWIEDQTLTCDDTGNWTCTCTLEQTYAAA